MPFHFLKILSPTHYFSLQRKGGQYIYPMVDALPQKVQEKIAIDRSYTSQLAVDYNSSYAAIHQGYIGNAKCYETFEKLPVQDEYRFIRKHFHPVWVLYVLIFRICRFKNPVREISAYLKTRGTSRVYYSQHPIISNDDVASHKLTNFPKVSVIIPTLNRYPYLKDVLEDLEKQDYPEFEVIVIDQSDPFQRDFYEGYHLDLKVEYQEEKALWLARNNAIRLSKGDLILLFDDDSRVEPDWIKQHLRCLEYFDADLSSGVSLSKNGREVPDSYRYFMISSQLDTGNVLLKKAIFKDIGLFDRQFEKQRMGDGEYGLRSFLEGYRNVSNPLAKRLHLKVGSGGLREMGSWDGFRPKKWLDPRPIPSVLYFFRSYFGDKCARQVLLRTVPPSILPYRFKGNRLMMVLGLVLSIFLLPIVLIQVWISWRRSSEKLRQGDKIGVL